MTRDYPVRTLDQLSPLIVAFRKARDLSQTGVAAKLGVTPQAIWKLERNLTRASFDRLFGLLAALNVEIVLRSRSEDV